MYHVVEWKRVDKDISSTIKGKCGVHPLVLNFLDSRLARFSTQVVLWFYGEMISVVDLFLIEIPSS